MIHLPMSLKNMMSTLKRN